MAIKTVKFGGSSLADSVQIKKAAGIIKSDPARRYVVPSAPGVRFAGDKKVTDMLYACYGVARNGGDVRAAFAEIRNRFDGIIQELDLDLSLEREYDEIIENIITRRRNMPYGEPEKISSNYAASRGEYLNGKILAEFLGFEFVDAADVILFDENGKLLLDESVNALRQRLDGAENAVIPGFYGKVKDCSYDKIVTFSRGGSDITGSIVANAVKADVYENWTDVSGFLVADPRIVDSPEVIDTVTYRELRELSYMGATVLHEDAVFPVRAAGIPVNIRNTNSPECRGTFIMPDLDDADIPPYIITGIAGKKGFASVNIEKTMMNTEIGFCRKVLGVFEDSGISIEHMPSGIDTMSVFISRKELDGREQLIRSQIQESVSPDKIEFEYGLALLAVVGRGMRHTRGVAGRIFSALAHAKINVVMIDQGSSELNIIIGVSEECFEEAVRCIYAIFVDTK
ncbi:MAG: aspartate kinase [Oscillospiraceae bacterium]|nr:aspartate kinase [Oscillospiraceae bacterium]